MKKSLFLVAALLVSGSAIAATDHYILRDGNHVQHLKVTTVKGEVTVSEDVDFEANASETGRDACSADVSGEAKTVAANELVLKKHAAGQAAFCELKVHLSPTGAKVEQSDDCVNFAAGICRFSTDGKELIKVQ
jgi:hypothetical protein